MKQKRITIKETFHTSRDFSAWHKRLTSAGLQMRVLRRSFPFFGKDTMTVTAIVSQALPIAYFNSEQLAVIGRAPKTEQASEEPKENSPATEEAGEKVIRRPRKKSSKPTAKKANAALEEKATEVTPVEEKPAPAKEVAPAAAPGPEKVEAAPVQQDTPAKAEEATEEKAPAAEASDSPEAKEGE